VAEYLKYVQGESHPELSPAFSALTLCDYHGTPGFSALKLCGYHGMGGTPGFSSKLCGHHGKGDSPRFLTTVSGFPGFRPGGYLSKTEGLTTPGFRPGGFLSKTEGLATATSDEMLTPEEVGGGSLMILSLWCRAAQG
jgi:hypothetical protein